MASRDLPPMLTVDVSLSPQSYRTLVTLNYFLFFYALRMIPFLGALLSFLYASIVDAYYCFECVTPLSAHVPKLPADHALSE